MWITTVIITIIYLISLLIVFFYFYKGQTEDREKLKNLSIVPLQLTLTELMELYYTLDKEADDAAKEFIKYDDLFFRGKEQSLREIKYIVKKRILFYQEEVKKER